MLHHAGGEILHDYIRPRDQFTRDVASCRISEIKRDAALIAVQTDKSSAFAGEVSVFIAPGIIASIRVLDLDDLGAKIGQGLRARRAGDHPGEIHHQQTIEGGRRALRSRRAIR